MRPPIYYVRETLGVGVDELAVPGPVKERLYAAVNQFHVLTLQDFSDYPELATRYSAILDMLNWNDTLRHVGTRPATIDAMSDDQAEAVAREIRGLYRALNEQFPSE